MKCSQVETVGDSCEKMTHKCENNLLLKKNKNKNQKISSKTDNWQLLCISKLMYPHSIISTENISKVVTVRHVAITTTLTLSLSSWSGNIFIVILYAYMSVEVHSFARCHLVYKCTVFLCIDQ
jgi:hypothetical protein